MNEKIYWLIWKLVLAIIFINAINLIAIYNWDLGTFYFLQSFNWVVLIGMGGLLVYLSLIRTKIVNTSNSDKLSRRIK